MTDVTLDMAQMSRGERLRVLRQLNGLSQAEVAKLVDKSRSTYISWEKDKADPDLESAYALAQHYGVSTDLLAAPQSS